MVKRLNKRQQREQEELLSLGGPAESEPVPDQVTEDSDADHEDRNVPRQSTGFAALDHDDIPSETSDVEEQSSTPKSKKKNRKKKSNRPTPSEPVNKPPQASQPKTKQKKPKKDDFDAAIEELVARTSKTQGSSETKVSSHSTASVAEIWRLLIVEPKFLDGDAELRRFFGSKVVNSAKEPTRRTHSALRTTLAKPPKGWGNLRVNNGLSMRSLSTSELEGIVPIIDGEKWWTFEHSTSYKKTQLEFLEHVAIGDPNGLGFLLQRNPWHIDTLLQLSEIFRHQEDHSHATDLVDRALFSFERSFSPSFNLLSGTSRLDFDRIENRPLFLALHRQILQMERRGCMRTAMEFAKVLVSLEPWSDPLGGFLHIDCLAPKSGMDEWLLQLWDAWEKLEREGPTTAINIRCLPGMLYARAACLRNIEINRGDKDHKESTEALKQAVLEFPSVVPVLADKAGINLSADIRGLPVMRIETGWLNREPANSAIHLLSHLYAQRSASTWKQPTFVSWMQETVSSVLPLLRNGADRTPLRDRALQHFATGPTLSMCRHVVICDMRNLLVFCNPADLTKDTHAYDPIPPRTTITEYDETYFGPLSDLYQNSRRRGARFGAHDGDAALAQQMIQQLLLADARGENRGLGVPPGAFMDDGNPVHDENAYEDDDDDDEATEAPQAPPTVLQRFWQSLFGGPAAQDETEPNAE
ncbi:hypothetical protein FRC03_002524 [Tulasnella sp. 419]|nr:hypothetical protein FRC03_002524 [Tulasnella sp. 419]